MNFLRQSLFRKVLLVGVALVVLCAIFYVPILTAMGSYLVNASEPVKADAIFVFAGDGMGNRITKAAELVEQGYAPVAIVSGPRAYYGVYECDLAIPYAVHKGYPESYFEHFEHYANSTEEEADLAAPIIREHGIHRLLLVTSDFHTRRAMKQMQRALPDVELTMVAAPDNSFSADGWWKSRQGQKTFLYEWLKTIATWFGI